MASAKKCHDDDQLALEVTVISAESLKNRSSPLLPGRRLRPYVTLSSAAAAHRRDQSQPPPPYRTRVDEGGARNPTWRDTIRLPVGSSFLRGAAAGQEEEENEGGAAVHVRVFSKRLLRRPSRLGWCRIPARDVLDGLRPPSVQRRLSYALRHPRHGGSGDGVIHLAVRLLGPHLERQTSPAPRTAPEPGWCRVAIGIPAAGFPVSEWGPHVAHWRGS